MADCVFGSRATRGGPRHSEKSVVWHHNLRWLEHYLDLPPSAHVTLPILGHLQARLAADRANKPPARGAWGAANVAI
jgi:hypothetical protein